VSPARRVWKGNGDLTRALIPVGKLEPHPRNPRRGDVDLIRESLERFGQQRPILIDAEHRIVAGNHTFQAAVALGWTHVAALRTDLTDPQEIERYLVADNRTSDLATYDNAELLALLKAQPELRGTGYDEDDTALIEAVERARAEERQPGSAEAFRMILRYDQPTYERMIARMDVLAEEYEVESYSEVVARMVGA
jgi:ParB-like chromosome segregation protein Spo0J